MTLGGWIIMVIAVGGMTALLLWCVSRVIRAPQSTEHMHAPPDIDTHDLDSD
jgi:hypothetical protein